MVHELLGIKNHRVDLSGVAGIRDMQVCGSCDSHMIPTLDHVIHKSPALSHVTLSSQEVVLSPEHDEFFREVQVSSCDIKPHLVFSPGFIKKIWMKIFTTSTKIILLLLNVQNECNVCLVNLTFFTRST